MEQVLKDYGLAGVVIAGLAWYIRYLHLLYEKRSNDIETRHKSERGEWLKVAKDSTEAIREHTSIVSSLKTLLENSAP